jgi:hypothetical protein
MKFSADQHLAIARRLREAAYHLPPDDPRRVALRSRVQLFLARGKLARDEDWPSDPVGAACALTREEADLFVGADRETWRRVYVPYLTPTEQESLLREAKETAEFCRKAFPHLRPRNE